MRGIPLTNGGLALVDDRDAPLVSGLKWWRDDKRNRAISYAKNSLGAMHRLILGLKKGDGVHTDHVDGNGLNNQRYNLVATTCSRNQVNRRKSRSSSGYQGIYWDSVNRRFKVQTKKQRKNYYLGSARTLSEAVRIYRSGFRKIWGEESNLPISHHEAYPGERPD